MVSGRHRKSFLYRVGVQLGIVSLVATAAIAWQSTRVPDFIDLWLTGDQQGRLAFDRREWKQAAGQFDDPAWKGTAAYFGGLYDAAAGSFARIPSAEGYFNRGDALMKSADYRGAVKAFELAVAAAPEWPQARENLELAEYTVAYIEQAREDSDTGDQDELSADEFEFDNEDHRGQETEITRESTIELQSAEKWMRAVDTKTAEFLRTRFQLEAARKASQ